MSEYIIKLADNDAPMMTTAEEIVRCGDCSYCMAYMAGAYCDHMAHSVELDGFCAWGERKESC